MPLSRNFNSALLCASMACFVAPAAIAQQSASQMRPSDLAATVEALIAVDAKAALSLKKDISPVKASSTLSAAGKSDEKPRVVVEYILGQGNDLHAGLNVDGTQVMVSVGSAVAGGYKVAVIDGQCVVAIRPQKPKPAPASAETRKASRLKGSQDPTKSTMWPKIAGIGERWCFKETDAASLAASVVERDAVKNTTGLPLLLPKGSPLPPQMPK